MKDQELRYYKQFADFLQKYEESQEKSTVTLGDKTLQVKLIAGDTKVNLKNKLDDLSNDLTNPFKYIRNWVKGEMMSLGALISAIGEKESCDVRKQAAIKKLADDRTLNSKLGAGKFTIGGIFKSKNDKAKQ